MKTLGICALVALATLGVAPVMAAGPMLDKAVAFAAPDSGARLSDICYAVYKAVQESPEEADVVFSQVISQRTNWTAGEVYAIFRAVLLARPDLEEEFRAHAASYKPSTGMEGKDTYTGDAAKDPMLYKLLTALYEASLPEGVVPMVINSLMENAVDLAQINAGVIEGRIGVGGGETTLDRGTPSITPPDVDDIPMDIPTPGPMSPQH